MAKGERTGFKLKSQLEHAAALLQAGKAEEALPLLREIAPLLRGSQGWRLLVGALESLGREQEAFEALLTAARAQPGDHELGLRAALALYERDEHAQAAGIFDRLSPQTRDDPEILARWAHALLMSGRGADALRPSRSAFSRKPKGVPALVHGLAAIEAGELSAARDALERASQTLPDPQRASAEGLLGLVLFWGGEIAPALELWKALDARGSLDPSLCTFVAIAAAMSSDEPLARAALARAPEPEGSVAQLARARVELSLGRPQQALEALDQIHEPPELVAPLVSVSRGRALRLLGREAEALSVLEPLAGTLSGPLAAMALVDLGRIQSDQGRHEDAASLFSRALSQDPRSAEAATGLELAKQRTAWRAQLASDAEGRITAARAEAEAMRHAFARQERELEMLRARLAQAESAAGRATAQAEQARRDAELERQAAVRKELETREAETADRAKETLAQAFGDALERCPPSLLEALRVAEVTYQRSLYTELHPAAVAVLFSGALERALYLLIVRPFDQWLSDDARSRLLRGSAREARPGRVEYQDRFVEAFDPSRKARAPSLGEVARAIARRREPQLSPFADFLRETLSASDGQLDALAAFVERTKEQLRDPVAHGRAIDLPQQELTRLRRELLFDLAGSGRGALPALVASRR